MKQVRQKELLLLSHNFKVRFALFCANQVKDRWDKIPECIEAVEVVQLWLEGNASNEECRVAGRVADAADKAANTVVYTAYAACTAYADSAAANAAGAAYFAYIANADTGTKAQKEQWDFYNELLHFDDNAEKTLLGVEA